MFGIYKANIQSALININSVHNLKRFGQSQEFFYKNAISLICLCFTHAHFTLHNNK
jgi:hypothetical protein